MKAKRAVVVDMRAKLKPGQQYPILRTFKGKDAEQRAVAYVGNLPDHEKGVYGIDVS